MAKYTRRYAAPLALVAALVAGACAKADNTATTDTALNRDLAMAGKDTAAKPALNDVPAATAAPAPAMAAPTKAAPTKTASTKTTSTKTASTSTRTSGTSSGSAAAPAPMVAAGTQLTFANAGETVCTNTKGPGDQITMNLEGGAGGATSGSAVFRVTESKPAHNSGERPVLSLALVSMTLNGKSHAADGSVSSNVDVSVDESKGDEAKKVGAGAVIGGIAGRVLGKSTKATVTGAVIGGAAGAAVSAKTADRKGCLRNAVVTLNSAFAL